MQTHIDLRLTQGQSTKIDFTDAAVVADRSWYAVKTKHGFYAATSVNSRRVYLHRFLHGLGGGRDLVVDHLNHDTLDNRRENLRVCTSSLNNMNRLNRVGSGDMSGVFVAGPSWAARIKYRGEDIYLGCFHSCELASAAVAAAKKAIGHAEKGWMS